MKIEGNGVNFSAGEREIVNFLRLLQQDREIICVDELGAAIDENLWKIIYDELLMFAINKTLIVITHKLNQLINKFDRIIFFEEGRISKICNAKDFFEI